MSSSTRRTIPPQGTPLRSDGASRPPGSASSAMTPSLSSGSPSRGASPRQTPAPVSARAAARKPAASRTGMIGSDDDMRALNGQLVEDMKVQLQRAETASEQYQQQLEVLQLRLDEITKDHGGLEEKLNYQEEHIISLQSETKEHGKQKREMEQAIEAERSLMEKEKDQQTAREEELQTVIQRLNESLKQKEAPRAISRSSSFRNKSNASPDHENGQYIPSHSLERSPSRNNSKLLLQKDKMIESLRLELAEAQIKLAEMEHMGDGRLQELEKVLLDTRMANARLMEDNESFQLLLSEKTLKGDFIMPESRVEAGVTNGLGSLADELESIEEGSEGVQEPRDSKKLELEVKAMRDQNKALTLYIDRIIGRLLQHEGFEHIIHDKGDPAEVAPRPSRSDKDLPPPPPLKDGVQALLQRAKTVIAGPDRPQPQPRPRPMSYMPPRQDNMPPSTHENPETAPSIPLGRRTSVRASHRRSRSDQEQIDPAAPAVVGQMVRNSPLRSPSGGPLSPGLSSPRQPFFAPAAGQGGRSLSNPTESAPAPEKGSHERGSSSNSVISDHSGDVDSTGMPSPPRSNQGPSTYTGAVMKQNQLRPLRLVKENVDDDEAARKKANRGSWIAGWFNRGEEPARGA